MQDMREHQIRERAYQIWMANGCVDGEADRHWLAAEQEVTAAPTPARTSKPAKVVRRRTPAAKAKQA